MDALIHHIDDHGLDTSYYVTCPEDCKDDVDRSAYKAACQLGMVITMGFTIVQPLFRLREKGAKRNVINGAVV